MASALQAVDRLCQLLAVASLHAANDAGRGYCCCCSSYSYSYHHSSSSSAASSYDDDFSYHYHYHSSSYYLHAAHHRLRDLSIVVQRPHVLLRRTTGEARGFEFGPGGRALAREDTVGEGRGFGCGPGGLALLESGASADALAHRRLLLLLLLLLQQQQQQQ